MFDMQTRRRSPYTSPEHRKQHAVHRYRIYGESSIPASHRTRKHSELCKSMALMQPLVDPRW